MVFGGPLERTRMLWMWPLCVLHWTAACQSIYLVNWRAQTCVVMLLRLFFFCCFLVTFQEKGLSGTDWD